MENLSTFIVFTGIGLFYLGLSFYFINKAKIAKNWPKTTAVIKSCHISEDYDEAPVYQVNIAYSYTVKNLNYEGFRIYYGYMATGSLMPHQAIYDTLKDTSKIEVRYNPSKPKESVITYGLSKQLLAYIFFGSLFVLMTGAAALYNYRPQTFNHPIFWIILCIILLTGALSFTKKLASVETEIIQNIKITK